MKHGFAYKYKLLFLLVPAVLSGGCTDPSEDTRVLNVYCALDQVYSEPILKKFEKITGISVNAKYDVEAVKTVGLINSIIAEKDNPRCDVLWNNEVMHTITLKNMGLLAPYISPSAKEIPDAFKDSKGYWTGLAARARVIIYNRNLMERKEIPKSIHAFSDPNWRGKGGIALPLFGTTASHASALFSYWGKEKAEIFFNNLKKNRILIAAGNAQVKDMVSSGELTFGLTDTDDANIALLAGSPVGIIFPDQDSIGALILPNSIAMIKNCPHPEDSKILIDYLLSKEVEEKLAWGRSAQIPLHPGVRRPPNVPDISEIVSMNLTYEKMALMYPYSSEVMKEIFLK